MSERQYDAVIVGGGHNGLTAAAYLSRAGRRVLLLERLPHTGGAAVSAVAFSGQPVRLSRYSYLVSLLPDQLVADLGLVLELRSRRTASFTGYRRDGQWRGLLVERQEGPATASAFRALTGNDREYQAWQELYAGLAELGQLLAPTLTEPLPRVGSVAGQVDPQLWGDVVTRPIGAMLRRRFTDDVVRGIVATDALIGTFASVDDPSLIQNRCLLYHLIGNGTGEWRVPVGGMGAVTDALANAAAGAEIRCGATVTGIETASDGVEVAFTDADGTNRVQARHVLAGVAPYVLSDLLGEPTPAKPVGAQLKLNLLLSRLPTLACGADPETAFAGTFHVAESLTELEAAHREAAAGQIPTRPPGEFYCHTLTDASILGGLAGTGAHTLTYFGLHLPATLFNGPDREQRKQEAVRRALATIQEQFAEPLEPLLLRDDAGNPCLEAKIPQDVEADLHMPGGHIFHGDLDWPWATDSESLDTPARRWGVATAHDRVLLCGSGARRGGAVSGLGGHNAAMALLEE